MVSQPASVEAQLSNLERGDSGERLWFRGKKFTHRENNLRLTEPTAAG